MVVAKHSKGGLVADDNNEFKYHNDEPIFSDTLYRDQYALMFAQFVNKCQTPMVVGLYGASGVGKTSLMRLIQTRIPDRDALTVWFTTQQYGDNEDPIHALAQTLYDSLYVETKKRVKGLVVTIGTALASGITKTLTNIDIKDTNEFTKMHDEERFRHGEQQVQLGKYFERLVEEARTDAGRKKRLVFFIDDLDQCIPDQAIKVLDALKRYLNIPGCIFFLGMDKHVMVNHINQRYQHSNIIGSEYLDRIVKLPFDVPSIEVAGMENFIKALLPKELESCLDLLVACLGDNPRSSKKFINILTFYFEMATSMDIKTDKDIGRVLALILLIKFINGDLYKEISQNPGLLLQIAKSSAEVEFLRESYTKDTSRLHDIVKKVDLPDTEILKLLVYLTRTAHVTFGHEMEVTDTQKKLSDENMNSLPSGNIAAADPRKIVSDMELKSIIVEHREWLNSAQTRGTFADLRFCQLENRNLTGVQLNDANLQGADLQGADLQGADLQSTILKSTKLKNAKLKGADLKGADLKGADLQDADLRNTNLQWADLQNANLSGALFSGAKISGAVFKNTIYQNVKPDGADDSE